MATYDACYKTVGTTRIMASVHPPRGAARATIVFIHGGALIWGSRKGIQPWFTAFFNEHGYTVVSIDYRLAPSTILPEIASDLHDALAWVSSGLGSGKRGPATDRVAALGRSAGGYLALLSGTFPAAALRPAAIVSFYGYGSILEDWYTAPSPHYAAQPPVLEDVAIACLGGDSVVTEATDRRWPFYLRTRQKGTWPLVVGGQDLEGLHPWCPAENVDAGYPPAFLVHGTLDTDVPHDSSARMAEALRRAGISHHLELLPGIGHAFDQDIQEPLVAGVYDKILAFLADTIG